MKIIKQSDYYDSIQAYGLDGDLVYVRTREEIPEDQVRLALSLDNETSNFGDALLKKIATEEPQVARRWSFVKRYRSLSSDLHLDFLVIGFCGKFYPCVRVKERHYHDDSKRDLIFYPGDEVDIPSSYYSSNDEAIRVKNNKRIQRFLNVTFKEFDEIFHFFKAPIVAFNITDFYSLDMITARAIVNPLLSDLKFYRVKDAFSAFQEIAQYIAGVLGDLSEDMVSISDKDMRDAKGFDDWSFKTRPSKNKS